MDNINDKGATAAASDSSAALVQESFTPSAVAQSNLATPPNWQWNDNPVDKQLAKEPTNDSTAGQVQQQVHAQEAWDKELNTVYGQLMSTLPAEARNDLKTDELNWLKFRDSENKLIGDVAATTHGTMYIPMFEYEHTMLIKQRVLQLHKRLEMTGQE